ncbi:MAG TPA: hemerythrin domain-containing protein [Actinophytocola sp.]|uniref:hemerythrin domain-containing protein n=1 Tax=Actinophytocola sp. TaxID=1872138 RepID=UPI002DBEBBC2|nr:hemerythrin domain-containing protein [Actinophytocola sp.]HEU5472427.1 hemerythrin domain-containing protein [Actinophytocola sp.]
MTTERTDLIDVILADHREFEKVFAELEMFGGTEQDRRDLLDHLIAELMRHAVAEEMFMYPAARKALPDGDEIVDHEIAEHNEAEDGMKALEDIQPSDPRFEEMVLKLIHDVRHHLEEEETKLLPRLRETCSAEELSKLGERVLAAKKIAPTRPHPAAPDTPPANLVLAPGVGLIDRLRDALTGRKV